MTTGSQFIESGTHKKVVMVGGDKMSSIIDYEDRATCIIFGDGCGAVLLEPTTEERRHHGHHPAQRRQRLPVPAPEGRRLHAPGHRTHRGSARSITCIQEGKAVFKFAVTNMADVSAEIMEKNGLTADDVAWLVPHQANKRIIDATANRMGLDDSKVMVNIEKYGNTTSGTIPLCLWEWESAPEERRQPDPLRVRRRLHVGCHLVEMGLRLMTAMTSRINYRNFSSYH